MLSVRNGHRPRARLVAVGARVPDPGRDQRRAGGDARYAGAWIATRTGIRERRVASPDEAASDLAAGAAEEILAQAGVPAEDLDIVLVATATPDHLFPATAALVAERIGARNAGSFDLMAGCTGFISR